jgi:hypothetical protein
VAAASSPPATGASWTHIIEFALRHLLRLFVPGAAWLLIMPPIADTEQA